MSQPSLTADQILAAQDLSREFVAVPEWGGGVYVQTMPGLALDRWEQAQIARSKGAKVTLENARAELVVLTAVNEAGAPLFTLEQVEALSAKSGRALNRIVRAAMKLNGLTPGDLDDLAKN